MTDFEKLHWGVKKKREDEEWQRSDRGVEGGGSRVEEEWRRSKHGEEGWNDASSAASASFVISFAEAAGHRMRPPYITSPEDKRSLSGGGQQDGKKLPFTGTSPPERAAKPLKGRQEGRDRGRLPLHLLCGHGP